MSLLREPQNAQLTKLNVNKNNEIVRVEDAVLKMVLEANQTTSTPSSEVHEVGDSGALSSGHKLPMWMVPLSLIQSCARRMLEGCLPKASREPYPIFNWRKGLNDPAFIRDRTSHAAEHLWKLQNGLIDEDNFQGHVDAVTWWTAFINEALRLHPEAVEKAFYNEPRNERY